MREKKRRLAVPLQYRMVLVLHDMEQLSTAEVAKVMGLRKGTVRVRLHRARLFVRHSAHVRSKGITLERGLRLMAGTFVLLSLALGYWVRAYWYLSLHLWG